MPYKNIEDRRKYAKEYLATHPEYKLKQYLRNKKWREENKELIKERRKIRYQENKERNRQIARDYYQQNKDKQLQQHLERARNAKIKAIQIKGGKCSICGLEYNGKNATVFDFHHINSNEKEFNPKRVLNSGLTDRALAELNKCILVCSNCHRMIHNTEY